MRLYFGIDSCGVLAVSDSKETWQVAHAAYGEDVPHVSGDINLALLYPGVTHDPRHHADGLVMTFGWPSPAAVAWAVVLLFTAVGLVISGLMIHVYMAAVLPEEPAFFSMITGSVHELYAYRHHFKWWREEKAKQLALRARREAAFAAAPSASAPQAKGPERAPSPGAGKA